MTVKEYNKIVDVQSDALYRFILKNLKDEEASRDIVQDSFEKLWINHVKVEFPKAKSYLFSTGYHTMIDYIRKNKRLTTIEEGYENKYYYTDEYRGTGELIEAGLKHLPPSQKSVLMLRDYEGYSYKEIADITQLSEAQVKVYIHRARLFMRAYVNQMNDYFNDGSNS